jgi:hypothetical protein
VVQGNAATELHTPENEKDQERWAKMGEKLDTVFMRRYFVYWLILSLNSFFSVIKGDADFNEWCITVPPRV